MLRRQTAWLMLAGWLTCLPAAAQTVGGAGSTFIFPILQQWAKTYRQATGVDIQYQPIGSSLGVEQVKSAAVDFAVSDAPLHPAALEIAGLAQFPVVIGGIVPIVNLDALAPGQLRLTGPLLADIFMGRVARWNHPDIAAVNPGVALPDLAITVVHRSDGSGTTFNLANYLASVSPAWRGRLGVGSLLGWPVGVGGKGNEGVATLVGRVRGAIGYVEFAHVLQHRLTYALVQNRAGAFVRPDAAALRAASAGAGWERARNFDLLVTDAPAAEAYPITATSFVLLRKLPPDQARLRQAVAFFAWTMAHGQDSAVALGYAPLPDELRRLVEAWLEAEIH